MRRRHVHLRASVLGRFLFGFCRKKIKMKLKNNAKQVARQSIALSPYNRNVISVEGKVSQETVVLGQLGFYKLI